jgi:hypothetical protein
VSLPQSSDVFCVAFSLSLSLSPFLPVCVYKGCFVTKQLVELPYWPPCRQLSPQTRYFTVRIFPCCQSVPSAHSRCRHSRCPACPLELKLGAHTFHRSIPKHPKGVFSSMCCYTRPFMSFPSPDCPYVRFLSPAAQILDRASGACCGAHFWSVPAALLLFGQVPSLILATRASSSSQIIECKLVLAPVCLSLSVLFPLCPCACILASLVYAHTLQSFRVWVTVRLYSPWKTTMSSGQDVSEFLDILGLVKAYFSSFLRKCS